MSSNASCCSLDPMLPTYLRAALLDAKPMILRYPPTTYVTYLPTYLPTYLQAALLHAVSMVLCYQPTTYVTYLPMSSTASRCTHDPMLPNDDLCDLPTYEQHCFTLYP
eukprot:1155620-Pelagomonas_calceolata.AAC.20